MDYIALATILSTLTGVSLKVAGTLVTIQAKFPHQEITIKCMYSECTAVSASLTHIQSCILTDPSALDRFQLHEFHDTIITGCRVLLACLQQDLDNLLATPPVVKFWKPWNSTSTSKAEWDDEKMKSYLVDMRVQHGGLVLLNELLMIKSPEEFRMKSQQISSTTQQQAIVTRKLRAASPGLDIPASIYGHPAPSKQPKKPAPARNYSQTVAFDSLVNKSAACGRSMGTSPSANVHNQPHTSQSAVSGSMDAMHEKAAIEKRDEHDAAEPDDVLPEYTPFPDGSLPRSSLIIDDVIRNQNTISTSSNVHNARPATKSIPSDRVPPNYVPGGPESLPLRVTPEILTYNLPIEDKQSMTVNFLNHNSGEIRFRVRTTAPKQYCVRPNHGSIAAGATMQVNFVAFCKNVPIWKPTTTDKFAIESILLAEGENFDWHRDMERRAAEIQRVKIKVRFNEEE